MLGSVVVAVVTVSLLFVGVYLGSNQRADTVDTDKAESYEEGFFESLDTLAGGLGQFAERGKEAREDRYQEYLKTQERIAETNELLQPDTITPSKPSVPSTDQNKAVAAPVTPPIIPKVVAPPKPTVVSPPVIAPAPVVVSPKPKTPTPTPKPTPTYVPPVPAVPPPSSVGADDLSERLDDFLSGFDLDYLLEEDPFDEAVFDEDLAE